MSILTVRFIGIFCVIDKPSRNGKGNGAKRVVLPVDSRFRDRLDGPHLPYIEVEVFDAPRISGRFADDKTYARDRVAYRRFQLSGDKITIENEDRPRRAKVNVLRSYTERVPSLS